MRELLLFYDYQSMLHKLAVYKKRVVEKSFSPFLDFSLFQHYYVLCNKLYEKTTICLIKISDFQWTWI